MSCRVLPIADLSPGQKAAWDAIVGQSVALDSPYFRRAFCEAVDAAKGGVEVIAWGEDAFLPFERDGRHGYPVARVLSDYQAVVAPGGFRFNPRAALKAAGLSSLTLDHLLAEQADFAPFHDRGDCSPYLSVAGGEDAYLETVGKSGRGTFRSAQRKARKMEREVGPLELEFRSADADALARLKEWKGRQYRDSGLPNVLDAAWTGDLFERLLASADPGFGGVLTTLRAGDRLAAAHLGLRAGGVLHWWFPTYDPSLGQYSPGLALLCGLVERADALGLAKIDLGKGMSDYKRRLMSGGVPLAEAVVERSAVRRTARRSAAAAKDWLRETPLRGPLSAPARWLYHLKTRRALR